MSAREYPPKSGRECVVIARELPGGNAPNRSLPAQLKTKRSWNRFNSAHVQTFGS
jgi:hypothetical protein